MHDVILSLERVFQMSGTPSPLTAAICLSWREKNKKTATGIELQKSKTFILNCQLIQDRSGSGKTLR
jgi:hypothetical protein